MALLAAFCTSYGNPAPTKQETCRKNVLLMPCISYVSFLLVAEDTQTWWEPLSGVF